MVLFEHDYIAFPELTNTQLQEFGFSSPHVQITRDFDAEVVKVHDGDTVTLRTDFRDFDFPLRLLDIDAPEMNNGGEVAKNWLSPLIMGQSVRVLVDSKQRVGKYGRLLGKIFFGGLDVGQEMLYLGFVSVFGSKNEGFVPKSEKLFSLKQWF